MSLLFGIAQSQPFLPEKRRRLYAVAQGEHVHVVVVPLTRIGRKVEVSLHDGCHRRPHGTYVPGHSPGVGNLLGPCPGKVPSADVDVDMPPGHAVNHMTNPFVAFLFVEVEVKAPAVVNLDEVEVPVVEVLVRVLHVVHP